MLSIDFLNISYNSYKMKKTVNKFSQLGGRNPKYKFFNLFHLFMSSIFTVVAHDVYLIYDIVILQVKLIQLYLEFFCIFITIRFNEIFIHAIVSLTT